MVRLGLTAREVRARIATLEIGDGVAEPFDTLRIGIRVAVDAIRCPDPCERRSRAPRSVMLQAAQYSMTADSGERDGAGPACTGPAAAPTAVAQAISNCRPRVNMLSLPVAGLIEPQSPSVCN